VTFDIIQVLHLSYLFLRIVCILLFLVVEYQSGVYSILISLGGTGMWQYYGKLTSNAGDPWVPDSMKLGENKLEQFPSGCGVVFGGDTMHAGAMYNADQCDKDVCKKAITKGLVCKKDPEYKADTTKSVNYYNLRLHLEVATKKVSKNGSGFSKSRCDFMKNHICNFV